MAIIIQYTKLNGDSQKGLISPDKQSPVLENSKRFYVELLNDDLTPKVDKTSGKKYVAVVHTSFISFIGFMD